MPTIAHEETWPALPLEAWIDTYHTLHMWTQIVGKIRLRLGPNLNHCWGEALQVTSRGLTTTAIPYGDRTFDLTFDFVDQALHVAVSDGQTKRIPLAPRSVADFYRETMARLREAGIDVRIWTTPVEVEHPIPFERDEQHASYDAAFVERWWRIVRETDRVMKAFRARFIGKSSPVHFFWGSFDLAVTRFSGRHAPPREGVPRFMQDAYSHEVISCGFWPGGMGIQGPAFYAYAVPEPSGFRDARVAPQSAFYASPPGEFLLMYDDVRASPSPDQALMDFFQSTYDAGADLAGWNRRELERAG